MTLYLLGNLVGRLFVCYVLAVIIIARAYNTTS